MLGIGLDITRRGRRAVDADAQALIAAMSPAPDPARAGLISEVITQLKAAGVGPRLDGFHVLAAHDAQAAALNWRNPATFTLTPVNAPAFVVDRGYTGNGTSSYLNTGFNPATAGGQFTLNSGHQAVWSRTDGGQTTSEFGNANNRIIARAATDVFSGRMMTSAAPVFFPNNTAGLGHFCMSRTAAGSFTYLRNGVSLGSAADTAVALTSDNFWICAASNLSYSTRQIAAAHWGSGLTDAETLAVHAALSGYMTAVGA